MNLGSEWRLIYGQQREKVETMKSRKDRGIVRIDQPEKYNHGWWVRRRRGAKMYSKFFADKKHGGKGKALAAARGYNDELSRMFPPPKSQRKATARPPAKPARKRTPARRPAKRAKR